jgi:hypothetical protein
MLPSGRSGGNRAVQDAATASRSAGCFPVRREKSRHGFGCQSWQADTLPEGPVDVRLDPEQFEQRGPSGYWYRKGSKPKSPMILKRCDTCRDPCLVRLRDEKRGQGRFCSSACAAADAEHSAPPSLAGAQHPKWTGDAVSYNAAHKRVRRLRGSAASCIWGCIAEQYEWASLTGDLDNPFDYAGMCKPCHSRFDSAVTMMFRDGCNWNPAETAEAWRRHLARRAGKDLTL